MSIVLPNNSPSLLKIPWSKYRENPLHRARQDDGVCRGRDIKMKAIMIITKEKQDELTAKAKASERLRMNMDLRKVRRINASACSMPWSPVPSCPYAGIRIRRRRASASEAILRNTYTIPTGAWLRRSTWCPAGLCWTSRKASGTAWSASNPAPSSSKPKTVPTDLYPLTRWWRFKTFEEFKRFKRRAEDWWLKSDVWCLMAPATQGTTDPRNYGFTNLWSVAVQQRSHGFMELRTHGSPFPANKILL